MARRDDPVVFEHERDEVTVGDLREWHYVEVTCSDCKRAGRIYPFKLQRFGNGARIADLAHGFKCGRCGSKRPHRWDVYKIAREV